MQFVVHHEFTQTSRGFQKKRIRFLSRVQIETFGNHLFFETRKGWFQEFGPIDIIYRYIRIYIYNRFEVEDCCLTGQVLS